MSFYRRSDEALPLGHMPTNLRAQIPQRDILAELVEEDITGEGAVAKALPVRRRCVPVKAPFCILDPCIACQQRCAMEGSNFCVAHACKETNVDGSRCPNQADDGRTCLVGYHTGNARIRFLEEARLRRKDHSMKEQRQKAMEHLAAINFFTRSFPQVGHPSPTSSTSSLPDSSPPATRHAAICSAASSPSPIVVPFFPLPDLRIVSQPLPPPVVTPRLPLHRLDV